MFSFKFSPNLQNFQALLLQKTASADPQATISSTYVFVFSPSGNKKKGKIYFTCSLIGHNDFHVKDYIKIINNNSNTLFNILQEPLKIKKIQGNMIICEYNGLIKLEDDIYTDIDMKIMNMSNQNIFYLSGSVTE